MLYVVLCIVTAGIFFLLTRWILSLRVKVLCKRNTRKSFFHFFFQKKFLFSETSYEKADHVLTQDTSVNDMADEASSFLEKVDTAPNGRRFFVHKVCCAIVLDFVGCSYFKMFVGPSLCV